MSEPSGPSGLVSLPDGRTIAYLDGGDPAGVPVIGLHGTPGCRLSRWPDDDLYVRAGVRYVTTDRAGYGRSTRHRGRQVADEAADVLAAAEHLGLDRFAVVGGAGGGPHALACAALLGTRVTRVACQSSLAPVGTGGMPRRAWTDAMAPAFAAELRWAEEGEQRVTHEAERTQRHMLTVLDQDPTTLLDEGLSAADVAYLARADLREHWRRIVLEQAVDGVGGLVDDGLAFARHWGFNLAMITVPVLVTHSTHDVSAPVTHGRWLASRIPGAELRVSDTGGHLPEHPEDEIIDTMRWLREG